MLPSIILKKQIFVTEELKEEKDTITFLSELFLNSNLLSEVSSLEEELRKLMALK